MTISIDAQTDATIIPTAGGNFPLQIVRWSGQRVAKTTTATAQRIVLPVGSVCVEITAVQNIFMTFGDDSVVTTKVIENDGARLYLAGVQVAPIPLDPATGEVFTHVSVIEDTLPGIVQIEQVL